MGIIKTNFSAKGLGARIQQVGDKSLASALEVMREESEKIAELARSFAPIDDGDLEKAIQVVEKRDGINGRVAITIQIDPSARNEKGIPVELYAIEMHEGQSIGANNGTHAFGLGKRSAAKDAGRGIVGGKFLERAARSRMGMIGKKIAAILRGLS